MTHLSSWPKVRKRVSDKVGINLRTLTLPTFPLSHSLTFSSVCSVNVGIA